MRLKHHDCDSQVVDSTRHCQFGTRGSEVQILSPRPLKSITYISITYIRFSEVKIAWGSQKGSQSLPVPPSDSTFGETSIFSLSFWSSAAKTASTTPPPPRRVRSARCRGIDRPAYRSPRSASARMDAAVGICSEPYNPKQLSRAICSDCHHIQVYVR